MPPSRYSDQHGWEPLLDLHAVSSAPLMIESLELRLTRGVGLVRCRSRDGAVGLATVNTRARVLWPLFEQLVAPAFVDRDARDIEQLVNDVYTFRNNYKYQGTPFWNCVAYAEAAVLDCLGQTVGRSLADMAGGAKRTAIPIYLSSMRRDTTPEDEVAWVSRRLQETGAQAVKLKIGGRMRCNEDSLPGRSERLIALARERFGPDISIMMDANGSYDAEHAIAIGRLMEEHACTWLEEPCPFEEYEATQKVTQALSMDVAGGEQDCSLARFRDMIETRTVDVIQPDLMYNGGFIRALRVAHMAGENGLTVTPHSPKHNPELATLLHFAAVVENTGPHMEFPARPVTHEDWYTPAFTIRQGGTVDVPEGPGLGISYDPDVWPE